MTDAAALIAQEDRFGAHNYDPLPVVLTRGQGTFVWDVEGRKYLDCLSAYSAVNQGHCHPRLVAALVEQANRLALPSRAFRHDRMGPLLEKLCALSGMEMALLMNSGAEAFETAVKAARKWGVTVRGGLSAAEAPEIIVCDGNFHGRTVTAISASSEPAYRDGFGPFTPGFVRVPFGDLEALRGAMTGRTVAFLTEPIQGEAGVRVPPDGYLSAAKRLCAERRVLFMLDEIQTGLGRTGARFAFEHEPDARPDVLLLGTALSRGMYPVSAVLASREVLGVFGPGEHGSTFGGNPLGAAVASAALDVLLDEHLVGRARALGERLLGRLRAVDSPLIEEVRGRGLLVGVVLREGLGARSSARPYCEALMRRGLLCKETHDRVLRIAPPLVVTEEQVDFIASEVEAVLRAFEEAPTDAPEQGG